MALLLVPLACGDGGGGSDDTSSAEAGTGDSDADGTSSGTDSETGDGSGTDSETGTEDGTDTSGAKFDVGTDDDETGSTGGGDICKVQDDGDAMGPCENKAPPDSFSPEVQWGFTPNDGNTESLTTPLVANLTDDNDDGEIDLCDTPDIVASAFPLGGGPGKLYVLDGETGALHYSPNEQMNWRQCPALGDIDDDGIAELIVQSHANSLLAYEHDGTLKWESQVFSGVGAGPCVALADVDNDGDVEIAFDGFLLDHDGNTITTIPGGGIWSSAVILVDLDDDDDMELLQPSAAYHHDGSPMWSVGGITQARHAVADLDDDGLPEVVIGAGSSGLHVLEHDGSIKYSGLKPVGGNAYGRPPAVHDIDGNGVPNFMLSTGAIFAVYEPNGAVVWQKSVDDGSGSAGSTAFDFLGDAGAEAMYGDEEFIWAYDSDGTPKVQQPRSSATVVEYPVVSDVDNDGSAEIVVPSSHHFVFGDEPNPYPIVQVLRDAEARWIQARRIWNQHTYHVTNVREDSTIPMVEPKHWLQLNTFRTNAQIENGGVCEPEG